MPRGPKKHLKRLNAPKHWMLDKLGGVFVRSYLFCDTAVSQAAWVGADRKTRSVGRLRPRSLLCRPRSHPLDHTRLATVYLSWLFCATDSSAVLLSRSGCYACASTALPAATLSVDFSPTYLVHSFVYHARAAISVAGGVISLLLAFCSPWLCSTVLHPVQIRPHEQGGCVNSDAAPRSSGRQGTHGCHIPSRLHGCHLD